MWQDWTSKTGLQMLTEGKLAREAYSAETGEEKESLIYHIDSNIQ